MRLFPATGEGQAEDMQRRDVVHTADHNRWDHADSFPEQQVQEVDQLTAGGGPSVPALGRSRMAPRRFGVHSHS